MIALGNEIGESVVVLRQLLSQRMVGGDRIGDQSIDQLDEAADGFELYLDPLSIKDVEHKRQLLERALSLLEDLE